MRAGHRYKMRSNTQTGKLEAGGDGGGKSFARQGAWMVLATVAGGMAMMLVHTFVTKRCGDQAYAEFKALLSTFYVIAAVGGGLWTLFGQQTAAAVTDPLLDGVAAAARRTFGLILGIWLVVAVVLFFYQGELIRLWKLSGPGGLWATWVLGLLTLWVSVARGLVQGRQNFAALGWLTILDGIGRFATVVALVTLFSGGAAGAISGAALGCAAALTVGLWGAREVLRRPSGPVDGAAWRAGFIPLAVNAAAIQLFQQYDNMFWQAAIPVEGLEQWKLGARYSPAQTIGFGLTQFTIPLALVMLPRIARSAATGEKSDSLRMTFLATLALGGGAALACTVLPRLPLQIMFFNTPDNWAASPLVPWFAWGMTFFTLANVLLNDLFARRRFGVVWVVVALAAGYVGTLQALKPHLIAQAPEVAYRTGVQVLCVFTALFLLVTAGFVRFGGKRA